MTQSNVLLTNLVDPNKVEELAFTPIRFDISQVIWTKVKVTFKRAENSANIFHNTPEGSSPRLFLPIKKNFIFF
jgi:hypothetical protein